MMHHCAVTGLSLSPLTAGLGLEPAGIAAVVAVFILALFVRTFVFQAFKIPTGSMENNLLVGDHLLVNGRELTVGITITDLEEAIE